MNDLCNKQQPSDHFKCVLNGPKFTHIAERILNAHTLTGCHSANIVWKIQLIERGGLSSEKLTNTFYLFHTTLRNAEQTVILVSVIDAYWCSYMGPEWWESSINLFELMYFWFAYRSIWEFSFTWHTSRYMADEVHTRTQHVARKQVNVSHCCYEEKAAGKSHFISCVASLIFFIASWTAKKHSSLTADNRFNVDWIKWYWFAVLPADMRYRNFAIKQHSPHDENGKENTIHVERCVASIFCIRKRSRKESNEFMHIFLFITPKKTKSEIPKDKNTMIS